MVSPLPPKTLTRIKPFLLNWDSLNVPRTVENGFKLAKVLAIQKSRCEMILSSARLSSNIPISTRNSCKTLKCPQCNWHYKYQETLEIHMREKHPDGESACGYCLAGKSAHRYAFNAKYQ
ncbi:hypothetical protein GQX74_009737 [Glossina fuscipes]|nr:hypothetical protein GQX74_009737 [Glossina fuscipes]